MLAGFLAQKAIYCVTVLFYLDDRNEASTSAAANCNESPRLDLNESDNEMPDTLSTLTESLFDPTVASGKVSYCDYRYSNNDKKNTSY